LKRQPVHRLAIIRLGKFQAIKGTRIWGIAVVGSSGTHAPAFLQAAIFPQASPQVPVVTPLALLASRRKVVHRTHSMHHRGTNRQRHENGWIHVFSVPFVLWWSRRNPLLLMTLRLVILIQFHKNMAFVINYLFITT
jgi:hypothetical protein